jgi:subtilisin family serine protease
MIKIKYLAVFLVMSLTACGGGGGSGASRFVENIVSELDGSSSLVSSYYSNIRSLNSIITNMGGVGSLQAVFTSPNSKDIENAKQLSTIVSNAQTLWSESIALIEAQRPSKKFEIYNSVDYKNAHASYLYLVNYVKPVVDKVANGQNITVTEFNKVANESVILNIITTEKNTTVNSAVEEKKTILENTVDTATTIDPTVSTSETAGSEYTEASVSTSDSATTTTTSDGAPVTTTSAQDVTTDVDNGDGTFTRTVKRITTTTITIPRTTSVTLVRTHTDKIYKDVTTATVTIPRVKKKYGDGREEIVLGTPVTSVSDPVKTFVRNEIRNEIVLVSSSVEQIISSTNNSPGEIVGSPTVITKIIENTITLDPTVVTTETYADPYVETSYADSEETTAITDGTPVITQTESDTTEDTANLDGSVTRKVYTTTIITTVVPRTTTVSKIRTHTDVTKKIKTTTVITTPNYRINYTDGTSRTTTGETVTTSTNTIETVDTATRTETITVSTATENITSTTSNTELTSTTIIPSIYYSDLDPNLGTRTSGYSSVKSTYETNEYLDRDSSGALQGWIDGGKKQVKASDAYSRGWTGTGVKIAVADTGYDTDHPEFSGQVFATQDYTGAGINDVHGHGTHVLGSIVAKKDGSGTHGVAFDATAAVIKIGNSSYVSISDAARGFSWAADQGAIVGNLSANSNYDTTFRNNISALADGTYKSTDSRYNYGAGVFYNMQNPTEWKAATDKGLVIVNSAGNQGLAVSANPGYFATAVDGDGNLVLGGKMLIVGAIDQNGNIASWSNKAGHICQSINIATNTCNDTYKVSDFYILAPGWTYSTKNDGGYGTMAGTSMAAPYVTGGIGLISQMWPYMKGENLVKLLTTTACKSTCVRDYNVNIHGSGLLDLDVATRPVGAVGIPTTGRTTSSVSTVSLSGSGGSGSSLSAIAKSGVLSKVMIVDEFARDFYVDLARGVTLKDKRKYSDVQMASQTKLYLPFQQQYGSFDQGGQFPLFVKGLELGIYNNRSTKGDWSTNLGYAWEVVPEIKLRTKAGYINEKKTWLGNESSGALSVGENNGSQFAQFGIEYTLDNNTFSWDIGRNYTDVNTVNNSVITSINNIRSESMKIGWEKKIDDTSKWGITYSLPSRVTRGTAKLHIPYATTLDGKVQYKDVHTSLKQTSTEKNIGIYYSSNSEEDIGWKTSFSLEYRKNIAGVKDENKIVPGIQISKKF